MLGEAADVVIEAIGEVSPDLADLVDEGVGAVGHVGGSWRSGGVSALVGAAEEVLGGAGREHLLTVAGVVALA